jgi:hypothetical protein
MHHILTYTPVWQRPHIFEICLKGIHRLQNYKPERYHIQPFFVISESSMIKPLQAYGYPFIFWQNQPLGAKKNAGLKYAMQHFKFDYLMEIGSDDLLTNQYLDLIDEYMSAGVPQFCPSNVYFIDTQTGQPGFWETDKILGLGRSISHAALNKLKAVSIKGLKTPARDLWVPEKQRGMDTCSWRMLQSLKVKNTIVPVGDEVYSIDLKSSVNINQLDRFAASKLTTAQILEHFPNEAADILKIIGPSAGD